MSVGAAGAPKSRPAFFLTPVIGVLGISLICVDILHVMPAVYVLKPLVCLLLVALGAANASVDAPHYRLLIIAGLAISGVGDVLLMLPYKLFSVGLFAFLIAHLFYISAFATHGGGRRASKGALVVFAAFAGVMLASLWPNLGALRIPVMLYVGVISTMAWQAWGRANLAPSASARRAALGAVLFLISDSTLAINRFHGPEGSPIGSPEFGRFLVMSTYLLAQWLIARSVGE